MQDNINQEHKSPWAYIVLFLVVLSFGAFYFIQSTNIITTTAVPIINPPKKNFIAEINLLEATASAIELPEFSNTN